MVGRSGGPGSPWSCSARPSEAALRVARLGSLARHHRCAGHRRRRAGGVDDAEAVSCPGFERGVAWGGALLPTPSHAQCIPLKPPLRATPALPSKKSRNSSSIGEMAGVRPSTNSSLWCTKSFAVWPGSRSGASRRGTHSRPRLLCMRRTSDSWVPMWRGRDHDISCAWPLGPCDGSWWTTRGVA